ncbi:microtubule-associated protein 9 [Mustela erminea]|uniref:microtubule-associated protein 9 n=1 Tax=Mustela erminea TaxID=36723 RepID=UPI0013872454|nr:microtubule-associated protein 9 [Mustela erminea]
MSDEVFSTILAYTKSPKVTKRTSFQDELIKAITARSARQRSSEYSDDFESDEIVSLGDFSDTSVDENLDKKKMNDFHLSDDEEKNSPKLSFLKTRKSNSDIMEDEAVFSTKNVEEMAPEGCGDMADTPLSESQNKDQEIEKDEIKMKPKPRILPVKGKSSENGSSLEADKHFKPLPRPRSMLKNHSHREEKDGLGKDETTALHEELEAHSAPSPFPKLSDRQLEAMKKLFSETLDPEDPCLTSLSSPSLKESLGDSFSPGSGGKASIKDQNEELPENHMRSNENEENSFLIDFVTPPIEKSQESQVITDDLEEEKEKAELMMNDLTVDPPLLKAQSILISTDATEPSKKTIEDRNMKTKKSTNSRASSASGRLMTPEFLKKSNSVRRTPSTATSSHYLGTLKVLDQKPSQKQNIEPERADSIRAAVYQEWLEKKNVYLHEMHRIKRIESENLRIQNEQKRAAKREEALASFEAWKAMKEKEAKKIAAQKRLEAKNKKKTEEENAVRKEEALQAFERWKEKKMEYLREKNKKEREYERVKKQKEEETIAEKRKDNLTAVEKWNEKKDAFFKEKEKEKINEKRREELKRAEKKDKDKQAIDEYEKWLEKKERQERIERKQKKRHPFLENEALPPWSPPSRTVFSKVF